MLTYDLDCCDLVVSILLADRGDMASVILGRAGGGSLLSSLTVLLRGEGGAEPLSSFKVASFQAGGDAAWNISWPLSSAKFAACMSENA